MPADRSTPRDAPLRAIAFMLAGAVSFATMNALARAMRALPWPVLGFSRALLGLGLAQQYIAGLDLGAFQPALQQQDAEGPSRRAARKSQRLADIEGHPVGMADAVTVADVFHHSSSG